MTRILIGFAALVAISLAGFVTLYVRARGDYQVLATVADDPNLPQIELNGHTFHSETFGEPGAPVIIVLHGGPGGDYRSLLGLAELADTYQVVFYDQRGAGLSRRVDASQLTAETTLDDLDAFINHYSPEHPVTLVGHSWGAIVATGYIRHNPGRVSGAVLAEPGYLDDAEYQSWQDRYDQLMSGWSYQRLAIEAGFEAQHVKGPDDHAPKDYLVGQRILPVFANHPDNPYHCPHQAYNAPSWRWGSTASGVLSGETFTAGPDVEAVYNGPVLFLASACNTWIGPELQARHAENYPAAELVVVPDAGHDMITDNPTHSLRVIRDFLRDNREPVAADAPSTEAEAASTAATRTQPPHAQSQRSIGERVA